MKAHEPHIPGEWMMISAGDIQKYMVRLFSYNREDFPENIRVIPRKSTNSRDRKHTEAVGEEYVRSEVIGAEGSDLARRGRIREGRIDTGELVFNGECGVTFPTFGKELIADSYAIVGVHISQKERRGRTQYILTFTFEYGADPAENSAELLELFEQYARDHYDVFVWENPDDTATINCMNRNGGRLRQQLVFNTEDMLDLEPVGKTVTV